MEERIKILEERCIVCQGKFTEEEIKTKKYVVGLSCSSSLSEKNYYHSDCFNQDINKKKYKYNE